jgi:hypothetical protein
MMLMSVLLALATVSTSADLGPEPDGQHMSAAEIKANNAKFDRTHPYYIRCQRREETGSFVKVIKSCRTNAAWERAFKTGNENARDTYEAMTSKATNSN